MRCSAISTMLRGVPLSLARQRLAQISEIARESRATDIICRHWPSSRFGQIERLAITLLESPPADLAALAMDELHCLRRALDNDMARFNDVLEDVYNKPDWRLAYLCYFIPFGLAVLGDLAHLAEEDRVAGGGA
jgi:hypothetical protein